MKSGILLSILTLAAAAPLAAQVGYEPRNSPFRDLERTMSVSILTGQFTARKDAAGAAPQSGPLLGVQYGWRAGGPATITATLARVESERRVLDPERLGTCGPSNEASPDCKLVGEFRWPLYFADAGIALSLTGSRSFYRLVPEIQAGIGLASDFHTQPDVGSFAFGTRFALRWGAGIRWVPTELLQVRADVMSYLYSIRYPEEYYATATDNTSILTGRTKRSAWLNNPALTIGLSYSFFR